MLLLETFTKYPRFYAAYIGDFEQLPFDLDTLRRHVER